MCADNGICFILQTITHLYLGKNEITNTGVQQLCDALRENRVDNRFEID